MIKSCNSWKYILYPLAIASVINVSIGGLLIKFDFQSNNWISAPLCPPLKDCEYSFNGRQNIDTDPLRENFWNVWSCYGPEYFGPYYKGSSSCDVINADNSISGGGGGAAELVYNVRLSEASSIDDIEGWIDAGYVEIMFSVRATTIGTQDFVSTRVEFMENMMTPPLSLYENHHNYTYTYEGNSSMCDVELRSPNASMCYWRSNEISSNSIVTISTPGPFMNVPRGTRYIRTVFRVRNSDYKHFPCGDIIGFPILQIRPTKPAIPTNLTLTQVSVFLVMVSWELPDKFTYSESPFYFVSVTREYGIQKEVLYNGSVITTYPDTNPLFDIGNASYTIVLGNFMFSSCASAALETWSYPLAPLNLEVVQTLPYRIVVRFERPECHPPIVTFIASSNSSHVTTESSSKENILKMTISEGIYPMNAYLLVVTALSYTGVKQSTIVVTTPALVIPPYKVVKAGGSSVMTDLKVPNGGPYLKVTLYASLTNNSAVLSNGDIVESSSDYAIASSNVLLYLNSLKSDTEYFFQVEWVNEETTVLSTITKYHTSIFYPPPKGLGRVHIKNNTLTYEQVTLEWDEPIEPNGNVTEYIVHIYQGNETDISQLMHNYTRRLNSRHITLDELVPGMIYSMLYNVCNHKDSCSTSPLFTFMLPKAYSPLPPVVTVVDSKGPHSLFFGLPPMDPIGNIVKYTVTLRNSPTGADLKNLISTEKEGAMLSFEGLTAGTEYSLNFVSTNNRNLNSKPSYLKAFTDPLAIVSFNVHAVNTTTISLKISIGPELLHTRNRFNQLRLQTSYPNGSPYMDPVSLNSSALVQYYVTDLAPNTELHFNVIIHIDYQDSLTFSVTGHSAKSKRNPGAIIGIVFTCLILILSIIIGYIIIVRRRRRRRNNNDIYTTPQQSFLISNMLIPVPKGDHEESIYDSTDESINVTRMANNSEDNIYDSTQDALY